MAQQTINVGTSANSGGGDPLRNALIKVNENFTEVYAKLTALEDGSISTEIIGSLKGSVFADDSTLIIDGSTGAITGNLTGNVIGNTIGYHTGDVTGSVFADDSTPRWMTGMCCLDYDTVAAADKFGNIFVSRLPADCKDDVSSSDRFGYCYLL